MSVPEGGIGDIRAMFAKMFEETFGIKVPLVGDVVWINGGQYRILQVFDGVPGWALVANEGEMDRHESEGMPRLCQGITAYLPQLKEFHERVMNDPQAMAELAARVKEAAVAAAEEGG